MPADFLSLPLPPMTKMSTPATARRITAAPPMTRPQRSFFEPPSFLDFGRSSSSSSSRLFLPALPLAALPFFLAGAGASSSSNSSSSSSTGSSTTKRYLHLGQSIFLPIKLSSLIVTIASQLGHCCLKLIFAAIFALREEMNSPSMPSRNFPLTSMYLNHNQDGNANKRR